MKRAKQVSESFELGVLLALTGGFMDAYSYICRGGVFANAQTGNILLIGVNFSEGKTQAALRYLFPVISFALGIALADLIRIHLKNKNLVHWRQISVLIEIGLLFIVSTLGQGENLFANCLTSMACGIQVESFRKIQGNGIATTMCIGNLRTATQSVCEYFHTKDKELAERGLLFFGIIAVFVVGAVIGNACVKALQERAILVATCFLLVSFLFMFTDREKNFKRIK